jgi:hypothetical protein
MGTPMTTLSALDKENVTVKLANVNVMMASLAMVADMLPAQMTVMDTVLVNLLLS